MTFFKKSQYSCNQLGQENIALMDQVLYYRKTKMCSIISIFKILCFIHFNIFASAPVEDLEEADLWVCRRPWRQQSQNRRRENRNTDWKMASRIPACETHKTIGLMWSWIFKVYLGSCAQLYSVAETQQLSPPSAFGLIYETLLISQDGRHLFVTPCANYQ